MDPEEIFKKFFGRSFPGFEQREPGDQNDSDADFMFRDWHHQMHREMEEMDKQMKDIFRIFRFSEMPSVPSIEMPPEGKQPKSNPREKMLKDSDEGPQPSQAPEPPAFSFPEHDQEHGHGILSKWLEQYAKVPHWNRIRLEDKKDTDLDLKSPSSEELADFLQQKKEAPVSERSHHPFVFRGNSVSIQTVIGGDGTVEERRTVKDSSGREETTVTRRMGDSSHSITTIRGEDGSEEKHETFNNIDQENLSEFDQKWKGDLSSEDSCSSDPNSMMKTPFSNGGILSDNRGFFRKLFGF